MKKIKYTILIFFYLFFVSLVAQTGSDRSAIFVENFKTNDNNWKTIDNEIQINNGKLEFLLSNLDKTKTIKSPQKNKINQEKNFFISVNTEWIEGIENNTYAIRWGGINTQEKKFYEFGITAKGKYRYSIFNNNKWNPILDGLESSFINKKGVNKIEIRKRFNKIEFYINNNFVNETNFENFFGDEIQLVVNKNQFITFDDFIVDYLPAVTKPTAPANLIISDVDFSDIKGNSNSILDAGEKAEISFKVSNTGKGNAYQLQVEIIDENQISGISFKNLPKGIDLAAGSSIFFSIPISASSSLQDAQAKFKLKVKEGNGFDANPLIVEVNTQKFKYPKIVLADYVLCFSGQCYSNTKINLGQTVNLKFSIQNQGQGTANNIHVNITNPDKVYAAGENSFFIKELMPNEDKTIDYEFFTSKVYTQQEIPFLINVTESFDKYGFKQTIKVPLESTLSKSTSTIQISGKKLEDVKINSVSLLADVDKNIPDKIKSKANRFALIFGNEDYVSHQNGLQSEVNVDYARNDALIFKEYCLKTLGIPEENIIYKADATAGAMKQNIDKLGKLIKNSDGKMEVIFYYAGHGFPDEKTKESYLIPVDVSGADLSSAIKLNDVYKSLSEFPSTRVLFFLDACFSGGARNQPLIAARGVKIKPNETILRGNTVVFSASSKDQVSLPYKNKNHGMFTYFLLKKIQETKGDVSLKELSDYINKTVSFESVKQNSKEQNPQTQVSDEINSIWESWRLR
jgi:hypothetical protein